MKLEELKPNPETKDGEVVDEEEFCGAGEQDDTVEEDLTTALEHLEEMLAMMERITVRRRQIVQIPNGMEELMQEVSEFLNQWESGASDEYSGLDC